MAIHYVSRFAQGHTFFLIFDSLSHMESHPVSRFVCAMEERQTYSESPGNLNTLFTLGCLNARSLATRNIAAGPVIGKGSTPLCAWGIEFSW
jgi:hypothetical protein